jgi:hypothetical protein
MSTVQAYRVIAKNLRTGIRVERQDLRGEHLLDESEAWRLAVSFAEQQQSRSRDQWSAIVEAYTTEQ